MSQPNQIAKKEKLLITGGSGFLGKNLAIKLKDKYDIILTSRNNKQNFIVAKLTGCPVIPMDVSNIESIRDVFSEVSPDIVIHGAATKFVDLCEKFPMEAIDVNITGSQNVARVSVEKGVKIVVGISTDKACPPVRNIYGLTKATMEKMFCLLNNKSDTKFTCVRYGNVAWSTGSVFPIWQEMFDKDKILRTTGPEMRRFFFTIDQAVNLVESAIDNIDITNGNLLSREMKSAQMSDILDVWIKNLGGTWEGLEGRPGERTDEYLVGELELPYVTELMLNNIRHFLISPNEKAPIPYHSVVHSNNCTRLSEEEILEILHAVPDIL